MRYGLPLPTASRRSQAGSQVIENGVELWPVGVDTAKEDLYALLSEKIVAEGELFGEIHFSNELDTNRFKQLVAEHKVKEGARYKWEPRPGYNRNEALDNAIYA